MRKLIIFSIVALLFVCLLCGMCFAGLMLLGSTANTQGIESSVDKQTQYQTVYGDRGNKGKLLSIVISGPILTDSTLDGGDFGIFSPAYMYGYDIKNQLLNAAEDDSIDGIILEINSPGGTITGSKAISDGVEAYREKTGNPVVAHISGVGASGAYWSASATDYIMIDAGSVTGSIGVIYGPFKYYDTPIEEGSIFGSVVTQNGIETKYFTGGQYKDNGSPYRRLTKEETDLIQKDINSEYDVFVNYVSSRRNISTDFIRTNVKALAYGNKQAIDLKLADKEATREEAYDELAKRAEVGDDFRVIRQYNSLGFLGRLFGVVGLGYLPQAIGLETNNAGAGGQSQNTQQIQTSTCKLCSQPLYFYGNPQMAL